MEEDGLVTRAPDPNDGRSSVISLSQEGRALLESVRSRKDAFLAKRMEALDADERATLERAATIIERMLET